MDPVRSEYLANYYERIKRLNEAIDKSQRKRADELREYLEMQGRSDEPSDVTRVFAK